MKKIREMETAMYEKPSFCRKIRGKNPRGVTRDRVDANRWVECIRVRVRLGVADYGGEV